MQDRNEVTQRHQTNRILTLSRIVIISILIGVLALLSVSQPARAQLDVVHYIPPMFSCKTGNQYLHLSTPETNAVSYTVEDGSGTMLFSGSVSNSAPVRHTVNGNVIDCNLSELNAVSTKGLIIRSDAPIYANIRHSVSNQGGSLTAKGYAALGTRFRAGVMRYDTFPVPNSSFNSMFIAVMATEDNTSVNFNEFKPGIVFYGTSTSGSPSTTDPISVVLDADESYVIGIRADQYSGTAWLNDINGTLVTSDKPVAVNTGTWLGGPNAGAGSRMDIGIDQMVPESFIGSEYILMQGNGGSGTLETPIVIATVNGTDLTVNGSSVTCTNGTALPMDAGEYCFLDGLYSAQGNMYVQATQPVYIFQTLAGATDAYQTAGMNFIPPINTGSDNFVDNIPDVTFLGSATVNILAQSGATVDIYQNGASVTTPASQAVTGTSDWVTYRATGLSGDIGVYSSGPISVQFTNVSGNVGAAGYYAGLPEVNLEFGDLPSAYSLTVLNDNGARHSTSSSLYLGASVDEETDGQASADAGRAATGGDDGTNSDDEDGVGVVGTWQEGANGGTVDVVVTGGAGCLSGWIDWNTNDSFGDSGDQVLDMVAVSAGANRLTFDIPIGALPTTDLYDRFSRFRLAPDTGAQGDCSDDNVLALTGLVNGGEVEDHYLRFSLPTGTGPGGVARSDGATSLALWLDAGAGTSSTTDGTPVSNWGDQSGYGHDAGQGSPGSQPTYQANVQNGRPVLRFDDSDDGMSVADTLSLNAPYSVFAVFNTTGSTANRRAVQGRDADWLIGPHSGEVRHYAPSDWVSTGLGLSQGQFYIAAATNSGSASAFWVDGVDQTSNTSPVGAPGKLGLGATGTAAEPLGGDLAEVIVYSTNLNSARRAIVENYLQARYNDSTADDLTIATDLYDGDTGANGNFDMDVAGIGRETDGDNWTAHSAGIIVQDVNFLQDNGDYLLYGHNTPANDNTTADVPTTGAWDGVDDQRWLRHWYFDRTDVGTTGGLVDIVFDYSEAGMDAKLPGGSAGNYRLLRRTNATGQFEDITATCTGGAWVSGDQITFRNVDVTCLGSNFTLGTLDAGSSPTTVRLRDASAQSRGAGTTAGLPVAGITLSLITLAAGLLIVRRRR